MGCSYWLILSCFLFQFCHADDTLLPGQSVSDGQTLVSTGGNFTLGFFSPGSSQKRYVGIWFSKVPVQTLVWVANRENPVTDSSGVLEIGDDGNLMVLNGAGSSIWSSNASVLGRGTNSTAKLLNTGNMILSDANSGMVLWQSFDHPSDTFLEGMKIGLNLKSGENQLYTSWKNPNDPSPGNFSFGVDPRGTPQVFVWDGFIPHWRTGQWKGKTFTGIPEMRAFYLSGFDLIRDNKEGKLYFTFSTYNSSASYRLVIDDSGRLQIFEWVEGMEDWNLVGAEPNKDCDFYNRCGTFGMCSDENLHGCNCLKGFEPRFPQDWALGNWSTGCVRSTQLGCEGKNGSNLNGKADGFLRLEGMKLPDSNDWLPAVDTSSCKSECMKNCSCVAFTYLIGSGCMVWGGDLVDLRQFSEGGEEFYIRLAASELGEKKRAHVVIIIVVVVIGIALIGACIYFMWCKVKPRESSKKERRHNLMLVDLSHGVEASMNISNSNTSEEVMNGRNGQKFPIFDLAVISNATDNFCYKNKLGEGGFGPVYKGIVSNGQEIAVKRLSKRSGQGLEEFKNEVVLIAKLQHRNLVRLLGCCIQGEEKMLIYEYMPNKSLDAFLFDSNKRSLLHWGKRFQIIEGIARGLLYLHRDSPLRIIHRDLKPSNILLDGDMNPKISDFGMARIFGGNQTQANTNRVVGTYGYMSPEYAMEGLFSVKSDVFSFGVLLLEIVSGRRNTSFYQSEHSLNLIEYAWRLWNENRWVELMDPSLGGSCPTHEVLKCIHVGLLCVQENVADRPTMAYIVSMMENESTTRPVPKQPSFYSGRRVEISSESNPGVFSLNDVTITMVKGR